jgi:hypothetical protein
VARRCASGKEEGPGLVPPALLNFPVVIRLEEADHYGPEKRENDPCRDKTKLLSHRESPPSIRVLTLCPVLSQGPTGIDTAVQQIRLERILTY